MCYCIAHGPSRSSSLLRIDLKSMSLNVLREARDASELDQLDISHPQMVTFKSDGIYVSGYFYPPKNRAYAAPNGDLPPVLLMGHGGPTAPAFPSLDLKKQFLTTRGFAVFDVNYRGSTGFGSAFRNMLKGAWGVVDRDDMINGARALVDMGLVDNEKVCISGSSAGGYLALSALVSSDVFKAAVSVYGVADLIGLVKVLQNDYDGLLSQRISSGWATFSKYKKVFTSKKIRQHLKAKLFNNLIIPAMLYSCECWALNKRQMETLRVECRRMARFSLGISTLDRWTNPKVQRRSQFKDILIEYTRRKWKFASKIAHMNANRWAVKLTNWYPYGWTRPRGRPKPRWSDELRQWFGLNWQKVARDEEERWKNTLERSHVKHAFLPPTMTKIPAVLRMSYRSGPDHNQP